MTRLEITTAFRTNAPDKYQLYRTAAQEILHSKSMFGMEKLKRLEMLEAAAEDGAAACAMQFVPYLEEVPHA